MSSSSVPIEKLAETIVDGLNEYAKLTTDEMKKAVKNAADTVKDEIKANAPKDTGAYQKSWATKKGSETSNSLDMIVYSKNRYQLAHLLEYGHAVRGGGKVSAKPHIKPAEEVGIDKLEKDIKRAIGG